MFDRCWSRDSRFFPCPFLHKKILTAPAFARPTVAHRKKTSCTPPEGNAPSRRCCSRCIPPLSRYIVYAARTRTVGWWEPPSRMPGYFFLFHFLRANEDGEEKGGSGRRNCTRAETPCGRREKQRDRREKGGVLDWEKGREETTLTVPRMAQILLSGGRCKKRFSGGE